jgi:hypothetical protein
MACSHRKADLGQRPRTRKDAPFNRRSLQKNFPRRRTIRSTTVDRVKIRDAKVDSQESAIVRIRDPQDKAPDAGVNAGESGKSGFGGQLAPDATPASHGDTA